MDRAKFLARIQGEAVKLTPFIIPGWDEPIYLRPLNMADIKEQLTKADEPEKVSDRLKADPYYLERSLAKLVRDDKGEPLFDHRDDSQMAELRTALDNSPPGISRQIQDAHSALQDPDKAEADAKGN